MNRYWLLLFWLWVGHLAETQAQSALPNLIAQFSRRKHYTMQDGLSNNWVTSIAQDDDGFLWFGTADGLNRFDGQHFTVFDAHDTTLHLSSNFINNIRFLKGLGLLVGTAKGLCLLRNKARTFTVVPLPPHPEQSRYSNHVVTLYQDSKGQVWVGTNTSVHVFSPQMEHLRTFHNSLRENYTHLNNPAFVREFLELPDGQIAIKHRDSRLSDRLSNWQIIDFQENILIPLCTKYPQWGLLDTAKNILNIVRKSATEYWITQTGSKQPVRLWYANTATGALQPMSLAPKRPLLYQESFYQPLVLNDTLLLCQRFFGDLALFHIPQKKVYDLPLVKTSWPDGMTAAQMVDRDGNLWIAPRSEGIYFVNLQPTPTTVLTQLNELHYQQMKKNGLSGNWFAFWGLQHQGQQLISSPTGGFYQMSTKSSEIHPRFGFKAESYVSMFAAEDSTHVWLLSLAGLQRFHLPTGTATPVKTAIAGLDSFDSRFIFRDGAGWIWGRVRHNGVCAFDTRARMFRHFPSKGPHHVFPMKSASDATEDAEGNVWFCFGDDQRQVVKWQRATGQFISVKVPALGDQYPAAAYQIIVDRTGNVWLLSNTQCLFVFNPATQTVRPFGKENGLLSNTVYNVILDRAGTVWFSTDYGLSSYNPSTQYVRTYFEQDGLLSNQISNAVLLDTSQNLLLLSSDRGLSLFSPEKAQQLHRDIQVHITDLWVDNRPVNLNGSSFWKGRYHENDLKFAFTGINFYNGDQNRYQYQLESVDKDWVDAGNNKVAAYHQLPPGQYRFRVRTFQQNGTWGTQEATLHIQIDPPFWGTWWARFAALGLLAGGSYLLFQRQVRSAERREMERSRIQQQLTDLEMKALRAQMNPHFVFNALNSVQNFVLKNDVREASRYLTKFARLMRLILENSESHLVTLAREIELLQYYSELEALRFNNRFQIHLEVDKRISPETVSIPGMLLQPHIENAIWHGLMHKIGPGNLYLRFVYLDAATLQCEIEDDGVGRQQAAEIEKNRAKSHKSTGLANIQHRLAVLKGQLGKDITLTFEDLYEPQGKAMGTKVVLKTPYF